MLHTYLARNREKRDRPVVGSLYSVGRLRYRYYIRVLPFIWDYSIQGNYKTWILDWTMDCMDYGLDSIMDSLIDCKNKYRTIIEHKYS